MGELVRVPFHGTEIEATQERGLVLSAPVQGPDEPLVDYLRRLSEDADERLSLARQHIAAALAKLPGLQRDAADAQASWQREAERVRLVKRDGFAIEGAS